MTAPRGYSAHNNRTVGLNHTISLPDLIIDTDDIVIVSMVGDLTSVTVTATIDGVTQTPVGTAGFVGHSHYVYAFRAVAATPGNTLDIALSDNRRVAAVVTSVPGIPAGTFLQTVPAASSTTNIGSTSQTTPAATTSSASSQEISIVADTRGGRPGVASWSAPSTMTMVGGDYHEDGSVTAPISSTAIAHNATIHGTGVSVGGRVFTQNIGSPGSAFTLVLNAGSSVVGNAGADVSAEAGDTVTLTGSGGSSTSALTPFTTALANRATTPLRILAMGDSRTEGSGATSLTARWQEKLVASLRAAYPTTGVTNSVAQNYVPLGWSQTAVGIPTKWSSVVVNAQPNNFGMGARVWILAAAGQGGTYVDTMSSFKLVYTRTSGASSFSYSIDGAAAVVVNSGSGTIETSVTHLVTGLSDAQHTIVVRWVSGSVYFEGIMPFRDERLKGIQIYDAGKHGTSSANYKTSGGDAYTTDFVQAADPHLVILGLGTNDYGASTQTVPATYKSNIQALVVLIKAGCTTTPSIVLTLDWKRGGTWTPNAWSAYTTALREIAAADSACTVWDLEASFPPFTDNSLGYFKSDLVHETDTGQGKRAELLHTFLTAASGYAWTADPRLPAGTGADTATYTTGEIPPSLVNEVYTVTLSVTSGGTTDTDTVDISVPAATEATWLADGTLVPMVSKAL